MIPKIIHYCWFGNNPLPDSAKKCIESWKKFCPDYEIKEWNESNFDLNCMPFVKEAYEAKKYAFVSDVARLIVVNKYGGIYFDTDVEVIQNIDFLLTNKGFIGFENDNYVATGLGFGSESDSYFLEEMIEKYKEINFLNEDGTFNLVGCPKINTKIMVNNGLKLNGEYQIIKGVVVLPAEFMNPLDSATGRINKTDKTISIHWYTQSWLRLSTRIRSKITKLFHRIFGVDCFSFIKNKLK